MFNRLSEILESLRRHGWRSPEALLLLFGAAGALCGDGLIWLVSPAAVLLTGTGFAICSLILSQVIPPRPEPGSETLLARPAVQPAE